MKTASLKSKGGFIFNATTKRYEWDNNLVNNTELISLHSDDIWYIFSHKVIRDSNNDSPFGAPGAQPYSSIADIFSTEGVDYLLFFDRDNIFANSANFTQLYNPDYYTFTIYKQPNFSGPPNVHDAYDLVRQYCQVQSAYLNRLKFSPAYIDEEKIVFKANTQLVRTVDDAPNQPPPESEIITDADYVIIEYIWTPEAGTDLDTRTQIQSASGMVHPVVGWSRDTNDGSVLLWNNDNTGSGREGILINIKEYAKSNLKQLAVSLRAFWFSTRGTGDVTLKATAYKGGNMVANSFGWDNYGGTIVSTNMASINVVTRQSSDIDGEYVGAFYYDLETKTGRIVTGGTDPNPGNGDDDTEETPPVINCIPTVFNITQIQGDAAKGGNVIVVASIWYEGQEYPYITTTEQMRYVIANVDGSKVSLASGFNTGINIYDKVYNRYPEFCKAIVLARNRTDNFFIAGASMGNLDKYALTPRIWDFRPYGQSFKADTMRPVEAPSQLRLTKLSPEMQQFIKDNHEYGIFFNGNYNVNNLVDMINQGNDIIINACVKVESNMFDVPPPPPPQPPPPPPQPPQPQPQPPQPPQPEAPPVVTTPPKPAMAIVNMISDTPFISTFKNGFELESYYDTQAAGYRIENENNKVYLRDPAYAPVVSFRPKQGNLMGATQIQGEVYDWQGIGFDISLATPKHLNKIQNIYGLPSNDFVLVMLSQLNEEQSAPPILNGRFICNPEFE